MPFRGARLGWAPGSRAEVHRIDRTYPSYFMKKRPTPPAQVRRHRLARWSVAAIFASLAAGGAAHAQTTYTYSTTLTSTAWLTTANWTGNTGHYPGAPTTASSSGGASNDIADFGVVAISTLGINFNTTGGGLTLGTIDAVSTYNKAIAIGDSSGSTTGVLTLTGNTLNNIANTIVSSEGSKSLTLQPTQGTGTTMSISLANKANVVQVNGTGDIVISTVISEATAGSALTVTGTSTSNALTLSGANSFSGGLVAAGAEVDVSADNNLGAAGGSITINGGRLGFATNSFVVDSTRAVFLGANPTGGSTTGTLSIKGSITTTFNQGFQNLTGSAGDLVKQGGGTLAMGGVSTYSGNTFLNNGITQLTTGNDRLPTSTTVYLGQTASNNTGTLNLNGFNQQIAGLNSTNATTGAPTAKNTVTSAGTAVLTLGGSGTYAYGDGSATNSGVITGALAVNKTGSGTQTLSDANTYTGNTSISAGTLILGPNGSINGSTSVQVTGTGALTLTNATALGDSSTLSLVSGTTLNLNGASGTSETIGNLILDGTTEPANTYTASQLMALDPSINFTTGFGETLTVTAVPEPATVFGGLLLVGAFGWNQRRRLQGLVAGRPLSV